MLHDEDQIQGRVWGVLPYDFRLPTPSKLARRVYQPGGAMIVPKVFGAGWTLNMAHAGTWLLLSVCAGVALLSAWLG